MLSAAARVATFARPSSSSQRDRAAHKAGLEALRALANASSAAGRMYTLCPRCTALEQRGLPAVPLCKKTALHAPGSSAAARAAGARLRLTADNMHVVCCFVAQAIRDDDPQLDAAARASLDAAVARSQGVAVVRKCAACNKYEPSVASAATKLRTCAGCRAVRYCSADCQHAHWPLHKAACRAARAAAGGGSS